MAGKDDDIMREDDGQDDAGQQSADRDGPVLRPMNEVPPIRQANGRETDKPEYEVIEVDEQGKPVGGADMARTGDEANLSEEHSNERPLVEQRRDENGGRRSSQRESHRERRERRRQKRDMERAETDALRLDVARLNDELEKFRSGAERRLNAVDAGRLQNDLTSLNNEIQQQDALIAAAENKQREAMAANDADGFVAAQRQQQNAVIAKARLEARHQTLKERIDSDHGGAQDQDDRRGEVDTRRRQDQARAPQAPPPLTGQAKRFAEEFTRAHSWFNPNSPDPEIRRDSNRVRFLDNEVANERYNPHTQEYWDELEARMREVMPHVFDDEDDDAEGRRETSSRRNEHQRQNGRAPNGNGNGRATNGQQTNQRRGPPIADVGGRGGDSRKTQVRISPDRKRAMIEQGSLNADGTIADPAKFERTLKQYAAFDARESVSR